MAYGSLGLGGFTQLGRFMQQSPTYTQGLAGLPKTNTVVPPDPEVTQAGRSGSPVEKLAEALIEGGSSPAETAEFQNRAVSSRPNDMAGQNVISAEPGLMSVLGLSTGTAYDDLGRGYDTLNFDAGAAIGGALGGLAGPLGGLAGGLVGRQFDANTPLSGQRNRLLDFGRGVAGMSSGERRAFEEARSSVMSRPMPQNLTPTERGLRVAAQERGTPSREYSQQEKGSFSGANPSKRGK